MSQVFGKDPANERDEPIEILPKETRDLATCLMEQKVNPDDYKVDDAVGNKSGSLFIGGVHHAQASAAIMANINSGELKSFVPQMYAEEACNANPQRSRLKALESVLAPIEEVVTPMCLRCPVCNGRHIDEAKPEIGWFNPPHKTHLCNHCGHLWRPHEYFTVGVTDEQWLAFMGSITDDDWKEVLPMAQELLSSADEAQKQAIAQLAADGFVRITYQMPLYARFITEPTDSVDHIRLWYVTGKHMQGDSIPWDALLKNIFELMKVQEWQQKAIMDFLKNPDLPVLDTMP